MWSKSRNWALNFFQNSKAVLIGPQTFAFLPALILGGYWFGGEAVVVFAALLLPAVFAVAGLFSGTGPAWGRARDGSTGMILRPGAEKTLDAAMSDEKSTGRSTAVIVLQLDDHRKMEKQLGTSAAAKVVKQTAQRITYAVRDADTVAKLDNYRFAVLLHPVQRADIEMLIQLSARIQAAIAEPISIGATRIYVTACAGFALPAQLDVKTGKTLLDAGEAALEFARSNGDGSIRAYHRDLKQRQADHDATLTEIADAMAQGQIKAWFQPQVSTDDGQISGFEALARWDHPDRGLILPSDFLPAIAEQNLFGQLNEIVLSQALRAIRDWEKAGIKIPQVAVNFSSQDLENPKLSDKVRWELDRFGLSPNRLCVEILEDVIAASENDVVVRNVAALSELGCRIDLDDFGTGNASLTNVRRFDVDRVKIDRSYVTRLDRDPDQQQMVSAVLNMAENLNIETVAEGVETIGEHAMLAQLGCGHVQGFSIARPMPFEETIPWVKEHLAKLADVPKLQPKAV